MKYFSFDSKVQGEQNEKIRVCSCETELWLIHTSANLSMLLGEKKPWVKQAQQQSARAAARACVTVRLQRETSNRTRKHFINEYIGNLSIGELHLHNIVRVGM